MTTDIASPLPVAVLLYRGCIFFEIALAAQTLAARRTVLYYTPDGQPHRASNGARVEADGSFRALAAARHDAVLVPGGDPRSIIEPEPLARDALQAAHRSGSLVAGICAGVLVMASAGLLRGRRGTHNYTAEHAPASTVQATAPFWAGMHFERADLVDDGNLVTAQPWAYRRYAATVARKLQVLADDEAGALERYCIARSCETA